MPGAFGLLSDPNPSHFPVDKFVEANARLDVFWCHRIGALVQGTTTEVEIDTVVGSRAMATIQICREGPGVTIDGVLVRLSWDDAFGVERPWFLCPSCDRRCRHIYFFRDSIGCRICFRFDYSSRHLRRQMPAVGRSERLRRKLGGCEPKPFAPLPTRVRRGRSRARHDELVAMIQAEEAKLVGYLDSVANDLERRIALRKTRGEW